MTARDVPSSAADAPLSISYTPRCLRDSKGNKRQNEIPELNSGETGLSAGIGVP